jgi:hypothetical protein
MRHSPLAAQLLPAVTQDPASSVPSGRALAEKAVMRCSARRASFCIRWNVCQNHSSVLLVYSYERICKPVSILYTRRTRRIEFRCGLIPASGCATNGTPVAATPIHLPVQTQTQRNLGQSQGARIVGRGRASADGLIDLLH